MKIPQFVTTLLPSFSKSRIIEDLNVTRGEIRQFTHPAYAIAAPDFRNHHFKSDHVKPIADVFARSVKGGKDLVGTIEKGFKQVLLNCDELEHAIEQYYSDDAAGAGMTYTAANLLQLAEVFGFVSRYARKLLIFIYAAETEKYPEAGTVFSESIVPADIEWIRQNIVAFTTCWNIATQPSGELKKHISEIPEIMVRSDNSKLLEQTQGEKKLDPFNLKFIPVWLNPIYHVKMFVAEWQTTRYHEAQEELSLLQLHRLHLEKLKAGKPDASLQQQISYTENRITKLTNKLRDMEKANG